MEFAVNIRGKLDPDAKSGYMTVYIDKEGIHITPNFLTVHHFHMEGANDATADKGNTHPAGPTTH